MKNYMKYHDRNTISWLELAVFLVLLVVIGVYYWLVGTSNLPDWLKFVLLK